MAALKNILNPKGIVRASNAFMLLCDMQEKLRGAISYFPQILEANKRLLDAAEILDIPIIATEQYSKALGKTVPELAIPSRKNTQIFEKMQFSMATPEVLAAVAKLHPQRNAAILFGIETALDLIARGIDVHLVADAASSRMMVDRLTGIERMRQSGAFVTTTESVLFQLLGESTHPKFKDVQKLIIKPLPSSGLFEPLGSKL